MGAGTRSRRDPRCLRARTRMSITARTRKQHAVRVRIPVRPHVPTSRPCSSALTPRACLQACVCRPRAGPGPTNAPRLVCGSHVHIRPSKRTGHSPEPPWEPPKSCPRQQAPAWGPDFQPLFRDPSASRRRPGPEWAPSPCLPWAGGPVEQGAPRTPAVSVGEATSWPQACPGPGSLQAGRRYQDVIKAPSCRLAVLPGGPDVRLTGRRSCQGWPSGRWPRAAGHRRAACFHLGFRGVSTALTGKAPGRTGGRARGRRRGGRDKWPQSCGRGECASKKL